MRAKLTQMTLVIFLVISSVAVTSVSTAPPLPIIRVVPKISTGEPSGNFTVDIAIAGVTWENTNDTGVYGWQFDMYFNPSLLEAVSIKEGPWLGSTGETTLWTPSIDNDEGIVVGASFLIEYPDEGVVGSGILANVTFHVLDIGACPLLLNKTLLRTYNWDTGKIEIVDHTAEHGFFSNVHDVTITSVTPSDTQVNEGDTVNIDVVASNNGDFNETFDVTTYWNIGSSAWRGVINETKTGIYLKNGTSTSPPLTFPWDTTGFKTGTYTISAEASVVAGEKNTLDNTKIDGQVTITGPVPNFTYSPKIPSINEPVNFTFISYGPDGSITSWNWDFDGNGTIDASGENATYTYAEARNYTAILFVTDDKGNEAFSYKSIKVVTNPVADFTASPEIGLVRQPVTFDASGSEDPDGEIVSYRWDFGDSNITTTDEPVITHIYTAPDTYNVNLTVTDDDDLTDSIAKDLLVRTKHDVALVSLSTSKGTLAAGETIAINIEVLNNGTETETFNVTVRYDNTIIQTLEVANLVPVDQAPNNTKQIKINWVTKDLSTSKYNLTAEVISDEDEDSTNNKATTTIDVTVFDVAIINVEVSPNVVLAGDLLNVTVVVENKGPAQADTLITVWLTNATDATDIKEGPDSKSPSINGTTEKTVSFSPWNASARGFSPGIYSLSVKATLQGEPLAMQDDNDFTYGEVTLGASLISISATPENITLGSSTTINGSITPLRQNVNVTIHHRVSGNDTWSTLETVTTDENGIYSYQWTPETTGTHEVMASWEGDTKALPDESETLTLIVNPATPILLYALAAVAVAAAIIGVAIYFLKIRKPKSV